jgi:hypothetical protein
VSKNRIILLIEIVLLVIGVGYYFLSYQPQIEKIRQAEITAAKKAKLEIKIQEALDPNKYFGTESCVAGKNVLVVGSLLKKDENFLYIIKPNEGDGGKAKIKLTPKTLFLKVIASSGKTISQEEISGNEIKEGDSVVAGTFCQENRPDECLALLVKKIIPQ